MGTYTLEGVADFVIKLFNEKNEEDLYETWLHKEQQLSFKEFKKKHYKKADKSKYRPLSREEEEQTIKYATRFIKPQNKGGE